MNRAVYRERRTYQRYDATHIIGYLNEEVVKDYMPVVLAGEEGDATAEPWPEAYAYTGSEVDGGTVMACVEQTDAGEVANAIIRSRYTESQELAIQRHAINGDYEEAPQEYEQYNAWCEYAVRTARVWIGARG